jgi:hypothetical protein
MATDLPHVPDGGFDQAATFVVTKSVLTTRRQTPDSASRPSMRFRLPHAKGMDTMRRMTASLLALGLMLSTVGCHHMAGICDCDFVSPICYWHQVPCACATPVATAEPVKQMPKPTEKSQ